jgi:dihydropteroate synthase
MPAKENADMCFFLLCLLSSVFCLLSSLSPARWEAMSRAIVQGRRPKVMGIVNVTPDSFSDGRGTWDVATAVARGQALVAEGADLLDIGGESSRPGAQPVAEDEELRRVIPVVEALAKVVTAPISVDTVKVEVARQALQVGASIVNDITALADPRMAQLVADTGAGVVLMHMQGTPQTMQIDPNYEDVVNDIYKFLNDRITWAESFGISRTRIATDPGIGFGKRYQHNLDLLRNVARFANLGCAVLVGTSRKEIFKTLTGRPVDQRLTASVVSSLAALVGGASVVRVHDVGPMVDAIKVWGAIRGWEESTC